MKLCPTLRNYDVDRQLVKDVVAGVSVASLAMPQSMSNALVAGLPAEYGLYGVIQLGYPILGSSPNLVVGPVAITALLTSAALTDIGLTRFTPEWVIGCTMLSLTVGILQLALASLGLGTKIASLLSEETTKAFSTSGVITLIRSQFKDLTGSSSLETLISRPRFDIIFLSLASLLLLEGCKRAGSRFGSLIVVALSCGLVMHDIIQGVPLIGTLPAGLPQSFPIVHIGEVGTDRVFWRMLLWAIPMAFLSFTEAYVVAKGEVTRRSIDANVELAAVGLANVCTSALGSYPVTGSFSRTAINQSSGATSALSHFAGALFVIGALFAATNWVSLLPRACIAAIVFSATIRLVDIKYIRSLLQGSDVTRTSKYFLVLAIGLVNGVDAALAAGLVLDMLALIWR